jgi:Histidine kinase/ATP dependent DNA ligase C terminal region/ATP dependent DNA ligase domain
MAEPAMRPMTATAGPVPEGPGWAFEFAWEGARTLADVRHDGVRLIGPERGFGVEFPELDALRTVARRRRIVLDGTIVALDIFGRPSLPRLRRRMAVQRPSAAMMRRLPVAYYVFDLLLLGNRQTIELPYQERRRLLERLRLPGGPIALAPSFADTDGRAVLDTAAQYGLRGVVAKRAQSRYQPGRRSRSWVETALRRTQDVIVGGWLPRSGGGVAGLLVGLPTERGLHYAGRVGSGFTDAARRNLASRLTRMERDTSPFVSGAPVHEAGVRWVAPELLGEVSYHRWTPDGRLDRPVWQGLRPGRHPAAVQAPVVVTGPAVVAGDIDELDEALRNARAEVDALRAQISPHFLYNVLNMITSYVRADPQLARELLADFANFTRYAFRTGVETSTVADELTNVERYLTLQRARFGERLQVDLRVTPSVLPVALPFLAVQLAVENAVQHSIEPKPGGGTVTISAVDSAGDCLITVSDDGTGADPGRTLRTLDERLRTTYGERRGLLVETPRGGGTRISFRVPR